ncbi:hypothetical protein [Methylotenera sp.]|uniref:hypothetical protein n=1 Tax=Methylotenera sp. TaxID=2051956 RepID=UPI0027321FDB|nr:hypothetical protein [Methylotenera sp.]MDP2231189.1 hypothetical protein [Methylotenera sp.]
MIDFNLLDKAGIADALGYASEFLSRDTLMTQAEVMASEIAQAAALRGYVKWVEASSTWGGGEFYFPPMEDVRKSYDILSSYQQKIKK